MNHVPVAIIGAGPAGLTLAHLLHLQGVESIVFESRTRKDVEETVRAGILEQGTLNLMRETGVGARMEAEADHDEAIDISINNERTRIPLTELTGHKVAIYPQHEYLKDFIAKRIEDGGELLFTTTVDSVENYEGDLAKVTYTEADGSSTTITADYVIAADGSNSPYRKLITEDGGVRARHEYPYAWFGILVEAPKTQKELIYATHPEGFALISTRTDEIQRYYLQCNPDDTPDMWPDDRIWEQLHLRADSPGITVSEGRIFDKAVLRFRSAVTEPMQKGRLFLAGDAAHTVPPTGAKGLNLAVADVSVLAPALVRALKKKDTGLLDSYTSLAVPRIWKAQHFSYWMSSMLHAVPGEDHFATQRRFAELRSVLESQSGQRYLAEQYVGRDLPRFEV
ncbi:putative 4-hydroxybenzoate 3-monooxygenase [Corynebacterium glutamicum MB001]|uniref:2-polyprenyl-6-methoxyphenol hydroxylase and related FAD-dependent oxidoreductases n=1 Tax=Corynebacterium glutamicum (strain ATCC 13032 / DSM 20300 / JCM 1318 / BCRC 11384 / CCUG 27702 / LMG 3730 / NBRC 12168 / NCIMB 10025 / NRRL B-2784 / 534) TaxID=196627 RepID=Q8NRH2_CORGL|nr:4-hydroxybenzoate 3-monooxygenase [Corynebacterium glutamicum]AGT05070.1 putative 4-hydroxybenzoate 3-monooxygenase [Corynebacterium glutamicum MB001]ARV64761.1 4-hydroxybenzoate 3-monooxygenase [Corynebacterium glutamicum]ASW13731.1 putative 4-hydroxybenzoate 3-monooxygenase [Corynebacterium glutamicum]AUI00618.1 4-hydroxybenzoate 3-monooxygenase [Corynebacterium glutamicum]AUI04262.1 4-hydroxybenzoate 3-monooxygenase [Corynebacterium glutamicum]